MLAQPGMLQEGDRLAIAQGSGTWDSLLLMKQQPSYFEPAIHKTFSTWSVLSASGSMMTTVHMNVDFWYLVWDYLELEPCTTPQAGKASGELTSIAGVS